MKNALQIYEDLMGALTGGAVGTLVGGFLGNKAGHSIEDKVNADIDTTGEEIKGKIDAGKEMTTAIVDKNTANIHGAIDTMKNNVDKSIDSLQASGNQAVADAANDQVKNNKNPILKNSPDWLKSGASNAISLLGKNRVDALA